MRKMILAVFGLAASLGWAQESNETSAGEDNSVDLRVSVLEVIDVTAEKTPTAAADESDAELDAILDAAEALEVDEDSE